MGTTADKLNRLLQTKQEIKQAIIDKGVDISDEDTFASYPEKISSIQGGGDGVNWLDIISSNGTRGEYLFYKCNTLTELDLSNLDTSKMTDMQYMFAHCSQIKNLDLSKFDTSNVTNMSYMFYFCNALTELDLSKFDTRKVITMSWMFASCVYITEIDVSGFDTSNVTNMNNIFAYCKLTSLDCGNWDATNCTSSSSMNMLGTTASNSCMTLVNFIPPKNINGNMNVNYCTALSHDSLLRILNNLMTTTTTKTLTLGTTNLDKLTDEEKAIATDKGWTLK